MDIDHYQANALQTALETADADYCVLGLFSEVGEIAGAMKKYRRRDLDDDELVNRVYGELGDVLWYVATLADRMGFKLSQIARDNNAKLASRKERGTLQGDGDTR